METQEIDDPMAKGSNYERKVCKEFSLWWTDGKRNDVFWRTPGSGGRGTVTQSRTAAYFGDLMATDPVGQPLLDCCCFELKTGYGKWSIMDLMDVPDNGAEQLITKFLKQVCASADFASHALHHRVRPVLISHRDRRSDVMLFPAYMYKELAEYCGTPKKAECSITLHVPPLMVYGEEIRNWIMIRLDTFLWEWTNPEFFMQLSEELKNTGPVIRRRITDVKGQTDSGKTDQDLPRQTTRLV